MSKNMFNLNKVTLGTLTALMFTPAFAATPSAGTIVQPVALEATTEAPTRFIVTYKDASQAVSASAVGVNTNSVAAKKQIKAHVETQLAGLAGEQLARESYNFTARNLIKFYPKYIARNG